MDIIDFKNVVEEAIAGFYISHVDGYFIYTNKKFANILGYDDFEDIKSTYIPNDIYYSNEDRHKFLSSLNNKGYLEGFVVRLKKKNGESIYVTLSGKLHKDKKTLSGWIIDITELIKKSKELELKNRIYEENPDAVFICDWNGNISYANKSFEKLIGKSYYEVKNTKNLFPPDSTVTTTIKKIINIVKKRKIFVGELNILTKEKDIIPCEVKIFALYNDKGQIEHFINIFRDISEKKELETQIAQMQKLGIIGKMTSSMIHDMNNIISSLNSYLELLRIFKDNEEKFNDYYNKIEKLIENSSKILQRVVKFTRKSKISISSLNINDIIEDIVNFSDFLTYNQPHIKINVIQRDNDLIILGNKSSLIQILLNLIVNAIDAINEAKREKGEINIYFDRVYVNDNRKVRIIVEDNGIGIKKEIKDKVFQPFFSTKNGKKNSGTGLGLSIVSQEVDKLNGTIEICSEEGKGTKFIILFPENNGRKTNSIIEKEKKELIVDFEKNILIIDDDDFFTDSISDFLKYYGFNVFVAKTGKSGIEIVKNHKIDLILLDFVLPDLNPEIILNKIKNINSEIPVYLISGLIEPNIKKLQIYKNVKMILAKPISGEDLIKRILVNI